MFEIGLTLGLLALALLLFITEWIRYDIVALLVLLALNLSGILSLEESFAGFSNPAVITVAAILVMSRAVQNSGVIQLAGAKVVTWGKTPGRLIFLIMTGVGAISGFINDVGATALLLPLVVMVAHRTDIPPSKLLIPLSFGGLLGGTLTLIGTPPNILVSLIMAEQGYEPFSMFEFTPIGLIVLIVGILYMMLIGQHLLPKRRGEANLMERFKINDYLVEVLIDPKSPLAGKHLSQVDLGKEIEFNILGIIHNEQAVLVPLAKNRLEAGDKLLVEVSPEHLGNLRRAGLEIVPEAGLSEADISSETEDIEVVEAVVTPDSPSIQRSLRQLNFRRRLGITVMAISRRGQAMLKRLGDIRLQAGDVLLLQGERHNIDTNLPNMGCLPLANREISLKTRASIFRILLIFLGAIVLASTEVLHVSVAFTLGAFLMVITRCIRIDQFYKAIEWPILILMGGMIPLGTAMETTGTATWVANSLIQLTNSSDPYVILGVLFVVVSALTMVLNNPTVAVIMAPIAIDLALGLEVSPRPFLMLTAVAASCAFLSPVSHKANILVWGPGGYKFTDYTRVGFPLVVLIGLVCVFVIPLIWPF